MLDILCIALTVLLLPILFVQGMWVRKQTPRLPEAGGSRTGWEPGSTPPIKLITLGESTVAGVGAATHKEALTGQIANALAQQTNRAVQWQAVGQNGVTATEGCRVLVPPIAKKEVDVLVIALGVNDVLRLHGPTRWHRDLTHLLRIIQEHIGDIPVILAGMPPVGQFPAFPQPLAGVVGYRAKVLDKITKQAAEQMPNVFYCPVPIANDDSGFATDGFHPGPAGYAIWGEQLARCISNVRIYE